MNLIQRGIITVGLVLMILLVVYPPWILRHEGRVIRSEYSFVWKAPRVGGPSFGYYTIDRDRWTIPIYAVVVATIGLVKVFESKRNNGGER